MACCCSAADDNAPPVAVDDPRAEELRGALSGIMPPLDVGWDQATVNMSFTTPYAHGQAAPGGGGSSGAPAPSPFAAQHAQQPPGLGTFERRHSMTARPAPSGAASGLQWSDSRKLLEAAIAMEQVGALPHMQQIPEGQAAASAADGGWGSGWGWGDDGWQQLQLAEQRLQGRLFKLKLEHCVQEGDGNCQFRAISFGLYGTPRHHKYVRRQAVAFMKANPQDFEAFLGEEFRGYLGGMAQPGAWGDELTLRAICEALAVVVNVISSDEANWFLRYIPRSTRPKHEVFVTYVAPIHYNAIRRQKTGDRLRRSFGRQHSQLARAVSTYTRNYGLPENPQHVAAAGLVG